MDNIKQNSDQLDFSKLINSLLRQKRLIVALTSIITLLVVLYLLTLKPLFIVSASVISPNTISIVKLNGYSLEEIEREEVFRTFLNKSLTSELQIKVFKENNFLSRLNPLDEPIEDLNAYMKNFTQTIELLSPEQNKSSLNEAPHIYSVRGSNPELIVDFLDNLISYANRETISEILKSIRQTIDFRMSFLTKSRDSMLSKAKSDRLDKIERMKEFDEELIRDLNDKINALMVNHQIDQGEKIKFFKTSLSKKISRVEKQIEAERFKQREKLSNEITQLKELAKLAKLRRVEKDDVEIFSNRNFYGDIVGSIDAPAEVLYDEKFLLDRISILENRKNIDAFLPALVNLKANLMEIEANHMSELDVLENQKNDSYSIANLSQIKAELKEITSNNALKTLVDRKDDTPFIPQFNEIINEIEAVKLLQLEIESLSISKENINAMQITKDTNFRNISTSRKLVAFLGLFIGLIFSILVAIIRDSLKPTKN